VTIPVGVAASELVDASELMGASVQWRCRQAIELDDIVVSVSGSGTTVLVRVTNTVRVQSASPVDGTSAAAKWLLLLLLLLLFDHGGRLVGVNSTVGQNVLVKTVGKPVGPPDALPLQ